MEMKKTKWRQVFSAVGRSGLLDLKNKSGVYLIKESATGKVVYVGYSSSNLYKVIMRHFYYWKDQRQIRVSYSFPGLYKVRAVVTTPAMAMKLEKYLILKLQPEDNPDKLENYTLSAADLKTGQAFEEAPF